MGTLGVGGLGALSPVGPLAAYSAIAVGVGALLGSFISRAVLRFFWHRLAGTATGIVVGPAAAVGGVARRVATHPETRLHLVGYLSPRGDTGEASGGLPRLGSAADISRIAGESDVERVIVTEQEMSEPATERLIEEGKAAGLALTFLPQHFGRLRPGLQPNRPPQPPAPRARLSPPPPATLALRHRLG